MERALLGPLGSNQASLSQQIRTLVILWIAGVEYEYETHARDHLIAKITDVSQPGLPPCNVYGTQSEYEAYAAAVDLASGNSWPIHMAQCCQEQYLRNVRNIQMPMESKDHTLKMASDVRYWQKYMQTSDAILDLYTKEIEVLERVLSQHISLTQAAIQIGGFRRIFNRHRGMLPYRNWDTNHLGRKRYTLTGIPNPYADVFHVIPIQKTFQSAIGSERARWVPGSHRRVTPPKTLYYPNPYGGPPDWVAVPEGTEPTSTFTSSRVRGVTDLAIPEGCLTDNLSKALNGEPSESKATMGPEGSNQATAEPSGEPIQGLPMSTIELGGK